MVEMSFLIIDNKLVMDATPDTLLLNFDYYQSSCTGTRTHNHLFRKWTLKHLAKLAKFG